MNILLLKARLKLNAAVEYAKSPSGAFAIALLGVALAVYATWFNDKKPSMAYAVALQTPVLSPLAGSDGLTIQLDGRALDVARTPLIALFVRFWNSGDTTFRVSDFDNGFPVGFTIGTGKVLRAEVVAASSEYLRKSLTKVGVEGRKVVVSPSILEPGDSFVVKALILKDEPNTDIKVQPIGKVAGVQTFEEFYPVSAEAPEIIINYRSKSASRVLLILFMVVAAIGVLNFAYALYRKLRSESK